MEVPDRRETRTGRGRPRQRTELRPLSPLPLGDGPRVPLAGFPHGLGADDLEGAHALLYERLLDVQRAHGQLVTGVLTALPSGPELSDLIESTLHESESSTRRLGALLGRLFRAAGVDSALEATSEASHGARTSSVGLAVPTAVTTPMLAEAAVSV